MSALAEPDSGHVTRSERTSKASGGRRRERMRKRSLPPAPRPPMPRLARMLLRPGHVEAEDAVVLLFERVLPYQNKKFFLLGAQSGGSLAGRGIVRSTKLTLDFMPFFFSGVFRHLPKNGGRSLVANGTRKRPESDDLVELEPRFCPPA